MAKKSDKTDESNEEDAGGEGGKGGKLKPIVAAVILLLVGMGVGSQVLGAGAAPVDPNAPTTTTTLPDGEVIVLDPITLNLADGRFLKVGLAFELAYKANYPEGEIDPDDPTKGLTKEIDMTITTLGSYTFEQLVAPSGKDEVKLVLLDRLKVLSDDNIADLYFHEFVMQ